MANLRHSNIGKVRLNPKMGPQPMEATPTVSGRAAVVLEEALWLQT